MYEQDVEEYLRRVKKAEGDQARRWWSRMVPIDKADMRTALDKPILQAAALDAQQIKAHHAAYERVRYHLPHCLTTFNLICRNGNNRKESICQLAIKSAEEKSKRRKTSTTATAAR